MRTLIILVAIIVLLMIVRFFYRQSSPALKKIGRNIAVALVVVLVIFLLATGRLHPLFAALAAAVPVIFRMLPLLRYVPLLKNIYQKYQNRQAGSTGSAPGQSSSVRSRFIHMTLNLDSGSVDGEVLEGHYAGKKLQDLSLQQLFELLEECRDDNESVSLLVAYLDRQHPDWRDQAEAADSSQSYNNASQDPGKMSPDEAYEILGLSKGASADEIRAAHRKLINKVHPDHGGSTYLSAKINQAKDTLLKNRA